jgi:hypothetical protein
MKKQTATEWLFAHLLPFLEFSDPKEREHFRKCLSEAKAMEKEQIVDALKYSYKRDYFTPNFREQQELFEQYYNETYGGDE